MTAFLPQNDSCRARRNIQLGIARYRYQYNYSYLNPLALISRVPINDKPTFDWIKMVGDRVMTIFENRLVMTGDKAAAKGFTDSGAHLRRRLGQGDAVFTEVLEVLSQGMDALTDVEDETQRPTSLDDYADLFREIDLPPIHKNYKDDAVFAELRVAGPNPVMLHRITRVPDHFQVTGEQFAATMKGDSLEAAGQENRLYLVDYKALEGMDNGQLKRAEAIVTKYAYAPLALLAVDKSSGALCPVAIQCKQTPGPDNPVFTPRDGNNWLIAKTIVEIADGNVHEAVTHLARTHLYIEPFCIAMHRQLARRHPLFRLLAPHFEGTLSINNAAAEKLVAPGGPVELLTSSPIKQTLQAVVSGVETYLFDEQFLPKALAKRDVADSDALPNYPYRDDALLYWKAIHQWVTEYVGTYYKTESDVVSDVELQRWATEVVSSEGGRIRGMSAINSKEYLAEVLTMVIYTASVQHAAVNFPQWDYMSYVPNMPLAGYAPAPTSTDEATDADYLKYLPPTDIARLQMEVGYMLGAVHYTQLGQYDADHFGPEVGAALKTFQAAIKGIGEQIQARNQQRRPYQILAPHGIPQSINI
jgi:arachidonate 15-lipoxygenase